MNLDFSRNPTRVAQLPQTRLPRIPVDFSPSQRCTSLKPTGTSRLRTSFSYLALCSSQCGSRSACRLRGRHGCGWNRLPRHLVCIKNARPRSLPLSLVLSKCGHHWPVRSLQRREFKVSYASLVPACEPGRGTGCWRAR